MKDKYYTLTKEDIESLGFRVESDYWIIGEEYEPNYKISISFKDYSTGKTKYLIERTDFNKGVLFEGIIKNKSELKRLLKQLEI